MKRLPWRGFRGDSRPRLSGFVAGIVRVGRTFLSDSLARVWAAAQLSSKSD